MSRVTRIVSCPLLGSRFNWLHAIAATVLLSAMPASAQVVQESTTERLQGSAGVGPFGVSYDQTLTGLPNGLSFNLYEPGYQGSSAWSSANATWTVSSSGIQYSDSATQTNSPTPSFTQYVCNTGMISVFTDIFQVAQTSNLTLTGTMDGSYRAGGGLHFEVYVNDLTQNASLYAVSANTVLNKSITLNGGDEFSVKYQSVYGTTDDPTGAPTFTDTFSSSFAMDVTPVPEPSSAVLLATAAGSALCGRRSGRRNRRR